MIEKRRYYDILENEEWLNEMAQDGHAMTACTPGLFTDIFSFEECEPGEYTFRVLMLDHPIKHPESMRYLRFLRESGMEQVGGNGNAVYLRKKAANGPFDIFTDRDSRLKYHKKMVRLYVWSLLAFPALWLIGGGILAASLLLNMPPTWSSVFGGVGGGLIISTLLTLYIYVKCYRAFRHHRNVVRRLLDEGLVYE